MHFSVSKIVCCRGKSFCSNKYITILFCIWIVFSTYYYYSMIVPTKQRSHIWPEIILDSLVWKGKPLCHGANQWQLLDESAKGLVYSAHFDDVTAPPVIIVIALAEFPLPYFKVFCRFTYRQLTEGSNHGNFSSSSFIGVGLLSHSRWKNGRRYLSSFVTCPLLTVLNDSQQLQLPYAVSVYREDHDEHLNFMLVQYSAELSHSICDKSFIHSSSTNTSLRTSYPHKYVKLSPIVERAKIKRRELGVKWRWNVTRCFPAFHSGFDDYILVAEMIAFSRLLGVDHFAFYVEDIGSNLQRLLTMLVNQGDAEVQPWNLHLKEPYLYYSGQFSSINDCLYRFLWSSKYVLHGDVDELFISFGNKSLNSLLDDQFSQNPTCGAFLFLHTFVQLQLPKTKQAIEVYHELTKLLNVSSFSSMKMMSLTIRHKRIHPTSVRSKPAVNPRKVLAGSVHVVQTLRRGNKQCTLNPQHGLLYHYRENSENWTKKVLVEDRTLNNLQKNASKQFLSTMKAYKFYIADKKPTN